MLYIRNQKPLHWTAHAKFKMNFYRLSAQRIRRVLTSPKRIESGIAPDTIAMMQPASIKTMGGKATWTQEIWVMLEETKEERKVISAWRYPGMTKQGEPLPDAILSEMREGI